MNKETAMLIKTLAEKYETEGFLKDDPSRFMHEVKGWQNQEAMAFIASCLSYGSRKQFFPKIRYVLERSEGEVHKWIEEKAFEQDIQDSKECYYRLYTCHDIHKTLQAYHDMISEYGCMKHFIESHADDGPEAVAAICRYFAGKDASAVIPKNTSSACKRICMFLRWMVRDGSPVDLGLWSGILDKRTLIMPLDTHVVQESIRLGLLNSRSASMKAATRLTDAMREIFPDDPLKGDFALFGYGVNN